MTALIVIGSIFVYFNAGLYHLLCRYGSWRDLTEAVGRDPSPIFIGLFWPLVYLWRLVTLPAALLFHRRNTPDEPKTPKVPRSWIVRR